MFDFDKAPKLITGARQSPMRPSPPRDSLRPADVSGFGPQNTRPSQYLDARTSFPPNEISDVDTGRNIFSPLQPVHPYGPPDVQTARTWDYVAGLNIDIVPKQVVLFTSLRFMAQSWGIIQTVIQTRIDQIMRQPWNIRLKDNPKKTNKRLDELRAFFRYPDGKSTFNIWSRKLLWDRFVTDTTCVDTSWRRRDGKPYRLRVLDGVMIKPLIDDAGSRPDWPNPAYQQLVKGLPWENFDEREILYAPMRPRPMMPIYGYSEVEQILTTVIHGINREQYQAKFWSEGTMPELIISVPKEWTPTQLAEFQATFDVMMSGQLGLKSTIRFVPDGMKPYDVKNANGEGLKADIDEWLARIVCYAFSVPPTPFIRQMNRATAESSQEEAQEEGLHPLMTWFTESIMAPLIEDPFMGFGYDDCEFAFTPEREVDELKQQQVLTGYVKEGIRTRNEARDIIGDAPIEGGDVLTVDTVNGPVPLAETVEANRQLALAKPDQIAQQRATQPGSADGAPEREDNPPKGKGVGKRATAPFRRLDPIAYPRPKSTKAVAAVRRAWGEALSRQSGKAAAAIRATHSKLAKADDPNDEERPRDLGDVVDGLGFDLTGDERASLTDALQSVAADSAGLGYAQVSLGDVGDDVFEQLNEAALAWAKDHAAELVTQIGDTTRDAVRQAIADGLDGNLSTAEIADNIAGLGAFSDDRAALIAETEVANANSSGALDGYRAARDTGVEVMKEWLLGPEPCDVCQENADAGPIGLDDEFPSGDDAPTAHPRCECALSPVVSDSEEKIGKARRQFACA